MRLLLTVILVASSLLAVGPATADDERERAARGPGSVKLEGRGYGHGRGMSQYGAQGAASQHGKKWRGIVGFYYPGTEIGDVGGKIKILITADTTDDVVVRDRSRLRLKARGMDPVPLDRRGARQWRLSPTSSGATLAVLTDRWRTVRQVGHNAQFSAGGRPVALVTPSGDARYRGALRSAGRDTINVVALEHYLRGVVPREVPALWHPQAVRAQSVAARTYAAFERRAHTGRYDLCDTTDCQVYGGVADEHPASDDAIEATSGKVVTKGGAPIFSQFSSSNGGWTVKGDFPYLHAQRDPWDRWSGNPNRSWTHRLTDNQIENAFPGIGDFQRLRVRRRDGNGAWNGRVLSIRAVGSAGSVVRSGDDFRVIFGLKSTWFRIV
ncbi:SpoIID/LytB domain protein [Nocardioides thalensis]|uniref:SpoIID/LytB domain protein n=1 Tax=Nocardioides thalensis TaxID=1914755 RepID=A0A853C6W3_9ACTN|nr:SpoIID/LytB domain-containing protein [Nocardioides thalensis]NYJ02422.1 SpoIID/LytB domain protein [Nocardioides thalensis]